MQSTYGSKLVIATRLAGLGSLAILLSQCGQDARQFDEAEAGTAGTIGSSGATASAGASSGGGGMSSAAAGMNAGGVTPQGGAGKGNAAGAGGEADAGDGGADSTAGTGGTDSVGGTAGAGGSGGTAGTAGSGGTAGAGGAACTSGCLENGAKCQSAGQCKSARCVDGVCCNGSCDGDCQACSEELTGAADGVCSSVKKGTDPHDSCATEAASTCGQTGMCGPGGTCALYDANTVCKAASCASGSAKSAQKCDGSGTCKAPTTTSCTPYICGASACLTSCSKNADCSSGQVCVVSACQAPSDLLGACDEGADCAKGDCINKMCGLSIKSVRVTGSAVQGGAGQIFTDGWFKTDSTGHNKERVSTIPQLNLHDSIDMSSQLTTPLPPNNYLVLTGVLGSNALTRTFQFNLSDGSSITKTVQASNAQEILLSEGTGDAFMLFQWTGATVNVLPKTY